MDELKALKKRILNSGFFNSPFYIKYNHLLVPMFVVVICLLVLGLVTIPQVFKLSETFKTINDLESKKVFYNEKIQSLHDLNLAETKKELETALIALPVDRDIPGVTGELLVALSGSGMSLNGITFSAAAPESEKVQEYSLRMDVDGTEESLDNFLERVSVTPRLIKLNSIEVTKSKGDNLTVALGFVTLYQQLPSNIGSIDEKVPVISQGDKQLLADLQAKIKSLPTAGLTASSSAAGKLNPFSQ